MKNKALLLQIIDETWIIKSALEADDVEIVLNALSRREAYISKLSPEENVEERKVLQSLVDKFNQLNEGCMSKIQLLLENNEKERMDAKLQENEVKHKNTVARKYTRHLEYSSSNEVYSRINLKK